jgi:hypothetical protein
LAGYLGQGVGLTRGKKLPPRACAAVADCDRPTFRKILELRLNVCRGHYDQHVRGLEFRPLRRYRRNPE